MSSRMSRAHNIPPLDDLREISPAQRDAFRENGHVLIHQLLNRGEIGIYRPLIVDAVKKCRADKRRFPEKDVYEKGLIHITNLWKMDEGVKQLVLSKRLARMAADLLGVTNVRIYHDGALFKEPGGAPVPWHQDQHYWPLDTAQTAILCLPLVDISVEMGMLTFASGSHKLGPVAGGKATDQTDSWFRRYIRAHHFPVICAAGMMAGDATWHYGNTLHNSPANDSDRMQEVMTVIYMADGARVREPGNKAQVNDWKAWLMGLPAGGPAASELNPLLL